MYSINTRVEKIIKCLIKNLQTLKMFCISLKKLWKIIQVSLKIFKLEKNFQMILKIINKISKIVKLENVSKIKIRKFK